MIVGSDGKTKTKTKTKKKPGAEFAFKPRSTISSPKKPDFSASPSRKHKAERHRIFEDSDSDHSYSHPASTFSHHQSRHTSRNAGIPSWRSMPLDRSVFSKGPLQSIDPNEETSKRAAAMEPDSDDDISALINSWATPPKSQDGKPRFDPFTSTSSSSQPSSTAGAGHPHKMISSRKQKAGGSSSVFIHQKSRPEHHRDDSRKVSAPKAPTYQAKKAPPLPVFDSNDVVPRDPTAGLREKCGEEVFYTDPEKASEDLKALLEGGLDEDEADDTQDAAEKNGKDGRVEGLKVQLLPHQVEGYQWMRGRELGPVKRGKVPKGGILADDMGLGKTLQTLALILSNQKPEKDSEGWKKHFEAVNKPTLVIAPLALIRQWEHEIKEKVSKKLGLKVLVHHGPQRTKDYKDLARYDVVVTTYQILVSEHGGSSDKADGLKVGCFGLHWWRVVLDEAHTIKNRNAKATKACYALRSEYRWCLSGTPMQNNLDELQSLVRFLQIKPYDDFKHWKEQIDKPLKNGKGHIAIRRLHSLLQCFMKRRTKDILKEEGALNPGGKPSGTEGASSTGFKVTERKVLTVSATLSPAERNFYDRLEKRADQSLEAMMNKKVNYANAFTLLLRLRQACNHPKLVEGKLNKDLEMMSGDSSQKSEPENVDSLADMLGGMGISVKTCSVCWRELSREDSEMGKEHCGECASDLAFFDNKEPASRKKPKNKSKVKVTEKVKATTKATRKPRNRNAILDSDDEEEDGSWLVPEDERGPKNLGKAGGEEDENAEGGGDWIGSDDSEEEGEEHDQSNLSSFVVDDEAAKKEAGYKSADEASDDDSLLSMEAITSKFASQTLNDKPALKAESDDETEVYSDDDASSTSDDTASEDDAEQSQVWYRSRGSTGSQIIASAKIRELLKILQAESAAHKFIVFSEFTSMLDLVEPFLSKDGINFTRYDGSMRNDERERSLRRLREDADTRVLLCSLKCGSLGLNLTAATRVVILEPFWNPFIEEQAIDRVHRLTQTVDVVVYKLTVGKTVEERILALQEKKRELAAQALQGGDKKKAGVSKLGLSEIIDLFKPGGGNLALGNGDAHEGAKQSETVFEGGNGRLVAGFKGGKVGVRRQESDLYGRRW